MAGLFSICLWYLSSWEKPLKVTDEEKKTSIEVDGKEEVESEAVEFTYVFPFNRNEDLKLEYPNYYSNRILYGIIILGVFLLSSIILELIPNYYNKKWFYRSLLNHFLNEKFKGDYKHNRITIFKITNGLVSFFIYVSCIIQHIGVYVKRRKLRYYLYRLPNPFRSYLMVYARRSNPFEENSPTHFLVAKEDSEVEGIVALSLYSTSNLHVTLPNLDDIDMDSISDLNKYEGNDKDTILQYMNDSKIQSFEQLRTFNRLSKNLWATPIFDEDEAPWGAMVFDNHQDVSPYVNIENDLVTYTRIIQSVIIHVK